MSKPPTRFFAKEKAGKIHIYDKPGFALAIHDLKGKEFTVILERETKRRTKRQNSAIHVYFQLIADAFQEAGIDARLAFGKRLDVPVTPIMVKDVLWRYAQKKILGKESTKDLTTTEIDKVYDVVNRFLSENHKIYIPFPSIECDDRFS